MAEINFNFGRRLKQAMNAAGYTSQRSLANDAGISANAMTNFTKKGQMPGAAILIKLAALLNVSIDWLLTGKEPEKHTGPRPAIDREILTEVIAGVEMSMKTLGYDPEPDKKATLIELFYELYIHKQTGVEPDTMEDYIRKIS